MGRPPTRLPLPLAVPHRPGQIVLHVEPAHAPVAAWLTAHRHGTPSPTGTLVPITLSPAQLAPAADATRKAHQ